MFYIIVILASIFALPAFSQGVDPLIGTWKLNLEKSTSTAPLPRSVTLTWSWEGQNLIDTAEGVDAQGQSRRMVFRHTYDGKPCRLSQRRRPCARYLHSRIDIKSRRPPFPAAATPPTGLNRCSLGTPRCCADRGAARRPSLRVIWFAVWRTR
jgi:hypothetical protein